MIESEMALLVRMLVLVCSYKSLLCTAHYRTVLCTLTFQRRRLTWLIF